MAKVMLICMYDDWALGVRTLSNALLDNGHDVSAVHFKLPSSKRLENFMVHPLNYENLHFYASRSEVVVNGYNIDINMWTNNEIELLGDLVADIHPDIIGLSTRSVYEKYINQVMSQMRKNSSAVTVAGGFGATFEPLMYLDHVDYVCIGEGESAIVKMANAVENKSDISNISNLVYKKNEKAIFNKLEKPDDTKDYFFSALMEGATHYFIENNTMCQPDNFLEYIRDINYNPGNYYTMCGRGCIYNCTFCSAGQFYQLYNQRGTPIKKRRNRTVDNIIKELKHIKKYGFKKITFMDSFLMGTKGFLTDLFKTYKKEIGVPFFAQFYPEQIMKSPQLLESACEAGLTHTVIGVQSGSERISNNVFDRKTSNENLVKFANMICKYGHILLDYHVITHNPFEEEDDFEENLKLLAKLPKRNAQLVLQRLRPFPGTQIHRMINESNLACKDMTDYHKKFLLYLIRYCTDDKEFNAIKEDSENLSFDGLKKTYAELRKIPRDSFSWSQKGWEFYHDGDCDKAMNAFEEAIKLDSKNWSAFNGKGWAYNRKKKYLQAIDNFKSVLVETVPAQREAVRNAQRGSGWAYYHISEYDEAARLFNGALNNTDPKSKEILQDIFRGLGWTYHQLDQADKSVEYFNKAIDNIDNEDTEILQDAHKGLERAIQRQRSYLEK